MNPKNLIIVKARRTKAKKSSSKTTCSSSAGKIPTNTPVSKPTIPKQNLVDFKGKSAIETAYKKAKNVSDIEYSDEVKNILTRDQEVLDLGQVSLDPGLEVMDPSQVFLGSGQELIY
ncbi:hypothetical protein PanWU01x14_188560 [Parasponia andersonii]|uniref:Uncharacterized protein n=1 Tax=Parasponia andersonii TaxID=3476 RepID=A0A2P5C2T3_PARAD|nr:hypothetical protein PanWU01x14_188560 [Parasponia andersonii]